MIAGVELVTDAHLSRLSVEPAVLLELLRRNRRPRVASQLVVKAVNVRLEARSVDGPPMRRPHCRAEYDVSNRWYTNAYGSGHTSPVE